LYSCIFTRGDIDERHIFLVKDFMQPLAISVLLRISSSLPPCASIWQPRYVKDSASSTELPKTDTDVGLAVLGVEPIHILHVKLLFFQC